MNFKNILILILITNSISSFASLDRACDNLVDARKQYDIYIKDLYSCENDLGETACLAVGRDEQTTYNAVLFDHSSERNLSYLNSKDWLDNHPGEKVKTNYGDAIFYASMRSSSSYSNLNKWELLLTEETNASYSLVAVKSRVHKPFIDNDGGIFTAGVREIARQLKNGTLFQGWQEVGSGNNTYSCEKVRLF